MEKEIVNKLILKAGMTARNKKTLQDKYFKLSMPCVF